jgi:hypothetical protein
MDGSDGRSKIDLGFDILDASICCSCRGFIVESQEDTGDPLDNKKKGGNASQAIKPAQGIFRDRLFENLGERLGNLVAVINPTRSSVGQRFPGRAGDPGVGAAVNSKCENQSHAPEEKPTGKRGPYALVLTQDMTTQA